ncbi:hypothetical protein ccbrp13_57710 [Ktedonobacteria bacterium brp13]|jgi:hypothetical protein|nr:hypothetical protein ccbrp13_57710 [Ktedonobacteria bacterium brp13]
MRANRDSERLNTTPHLDNARLFVSPPKVSTAYDVWGVVRGKQRVLN